MRDINETHSQCLDYISGCMKQQRFLESAHNQILQTMVQIHLLEIAGSKVTASNQIYYKVPDSMWTRLKGREPAKEYDEPPWHESSRI